MHPRVLQEVANILDIPLAILYNKSIKDGILPEDWKCANVTSIFKTGSKLDAGNYRPVSLTSVPCKILESLIRDSRPIWLNIWRIMSLYQRLSMDLLVRDHL